MYICNPSTVAAKARYNESSQSSESRISNAEKQETLSQAKEMLRFDSQDCPLLTSKRVLCGCRSAGLTRTQGKVMRVKCEHLVFWKSLLLLRYLQCFLLNRKRIQGKHKPSTQTKVSSCLFFSTLKLILFHVVA